MSGMYVIFSCLNRKLHLKMNDLGHFILILDAIGRKLFYILHSPHRNGNATCLLYCQLCEI